MTDEHRTLFERYVAELREAREAAVRWWDALVDAEPGENGDEREASAKLRWPDGAASHPAVIGVMQKYLRLCDELNHRFPRPQQVSLNRFAIDLVDSKRSEDVSDFLQLSYWPLGFDESEENLI